jgi:hypothetical protein
LGLLPRRAQPLVETPLSGFLDRNADEASAVVIEDREYRWLMRMVRVDCVSR